MEPCDCWESDVACKECLDSAFVEPACTCVPPWRGCGCTRPVTGALWCCVLWLLVLLFPGWRFANAPRGVYFPDDLEALARFVLVDDGFEGAYKSSKNHQCKINAELS